MLSHAYMAAVAAELLAVYVHAAALLCVCLHTLHRFEFWNLKWKLEVLHVAARGGVQAEWPASPVMHSFSTLCRCCWQLWLQHSSCIAGGC